MRSRENMVKKHIKLVEKELKICPPGIAPSELRFDLVSQDWIVIATGRARRPETFKKEEREPFVSAKKPCPFEYENLKDQEKPTVIFAQGKKLPLRKGIQKNWTTISIPNKFPAFAPCRTKGKKTEGPYRKIDAVGLHEVVITKDHVRQMAQFSVDQIKELMDVYQERYIDLSAKKFVHYISIFHNQGAEAGASISHPHSQIIAMPLTDPDIQSSIQGAERFFHKNKKCVHCAMNAWDIKDRRRVVFKNKHFLAVCPFASRVAFEVRIFPLQHQAYFEKINDQQKKALAEAFQQALKRISKGLNNPDYNFFLHTAPCDGKHYEHRFTQINKKGRSVEHLKIVNLGLLFYF